MAGTLFVVATPIGNLEDLTIRARRVLGEVDLIAAEDTRRTAKLLAHFAIATSVTSLHEHNESRKAPQLARQIADGLNVALVSDAGTPGLSDPGALLVRDTRALGGLVVPIPGPSAITTVLSVSGFPASEFVFLGFPPRAATARARWLAAAAAEPRLVVMFEAPHRIRRTLDDLVDLANRPILCFREISKMHEELVIYPEHSGNAFERSLDVREQGEFTIVLGPAEAKQPEIDWEVGLAAIDQLTNNVASDRSKAIERVAKALGVDAAELKRRWKKARFRGQEPAVP